MSDNLKPWFREDLIRAMLSVYFASLVSRPKNQYTEDYKAGFAAALSSVAIAIGINPENILEGDDLRRLREFINQ